MYARFIPPQVPKAATSAANDFIQAVHLKKRKRSGTDTTHAQAIAKELKREIESETGGRVETIPDGDGKDAGPRKRKKSKAKPLDDDRSTTTADYPGKPEENGFAQTRPNRKRSFPSSRSEQKEGKSYEAVATSETSKNREPDTRSKRAQAHDRHIAVTEGKQTKSKQKRNRTPPTVQDVKQETKEQGQLDSPQHDDRHKSIRSKFQKATQLAHRKRTRRSPSPLSEAQLRLAQENEAQAAQGLTPLPQPATTEGIKQPTFSALPSWLTTPTRASSTDLKPIDSFALTPKLVSMLKGKGFVKAFAVQSVVLPMLLPGPDQHNGDICISAATGSGKTMAYVLPIVESIRARVITQLRVLIVVPTRELVAQAREVCDLCTIGTNLKVGTAVGSKTLKAEQELLIHRGQKYDPQGHEKWKSRNKKGDEDSEYDLTENDIDFEDHFEPSLGHVVEYTSKVDILICTPGRLVDHIRSTPGFSLDHVQWLVIDEADRLLSESYQGWVEVVTETLERQKSFEELSADHKILYKLRLQIPQKNVRKIVLSATMTRDIGKLSSLKLRKPKLVVVDNDDVNDQAEGARVEGRNDEAFDLPPRLREWAIPVDEEAQKPLYLLQLLRTRILPATRSSDSSSESSSAEESLSDSSLSSDSADNSTSTQSSSDGSGSPSAPNTSSTKRSTQTIPSDSAPDVLSASHSILIFTSSNASALRLARLLTHLHPPYSDRLASLTSTTPTTTRRRTLRQFNSSRLTILIASELVARGMDIPKLAHIVNYDLPSDARGYLHRVGRTARAGRDGDAWSLVGGREARWFWRSIGRGPELRRSDDGKVKRVRVDVGEDLVDGYEEALRVLGEEVRGQRDDGSSR
ncbi:MAG: ATP-dependent RNA helicase dbp6 [Piccolia ochrophora]|nr:MAG: ATP-dependent RNA helicase dbp6 [Piccolia ochrophora]